MDRKKIYIAIIVVCFALTAGILYFNFKGGSPATLPTPTVVTPNPGTDAAAAPNLATSGKSGESIYNPPNVFPNDTKFDWTLLQSKNYQTLVLNPTMTLDPTEVGREDAFKPY